MTISELITKLNTYKIGSTERAWKMKNQELSYENEYIKFIRMDSSNKWISTSEMEKQWGIIFEMKTNFSGLSTYRELSSKYDVAVTRVTKGKNAGCYGLRFYKMKKEPDAEIVLDIFNYIFG